MQTELLIEQYQREVDQLLQRYLDRYLEYSDELDLQTAKDFLSNHHDDYKTEVARLAATVLAKYDGQKREVHATIKQQQKRQENRLFNELMKYNLRIAA